MLLPIAMFATVASILTALLAMFTGCFVCTSHSLLLSFLLPLTFPLPLVLFLHLMLSTFFLHLYGRSRSWCRRGRLRSWGRIRSWSCRLWHGSLGKYAGKCRKHRGYSHSRNSLNHSILPKVIL